MAAAVLPLQSPESVLELGKRLVALLEDTERDSTGGQLPETTREHLADLVEALRRRLAVKAVDRTHGPGRRRGVGRK